MDPNKVKHVTAENVTSEDIKPEGREDGPKNFGPEFVTGPGGRIVPTRPAEHIERVARKIAEGTRADGGDEGEVSLSFARSLPETQAIVPPSAQPVPPVVLGSMPAHEREAHEKKHNKKRSSLSEADKLQYDIGVGLAQDNKALPLEASDALEDGYNDTRDAMREHVQTRREAESTQAEKDARAARKAQRDAARGQGDVQKIEIVNPPGSQPPL